MNGTQSRRKKLLKLLESTDTVISGSDLSKHFGVSRQVIVQDIAILKAEDNKILSTNRGYLLEKPSSEHISRVFKLSHNDHEMKIELYSIVDLGATVKDVFISHRAYGVIKVELNISSRRDVDNFLFDIESGISKPLKKLTENYHYHTICAKNKSILLEVEQAMDNLGFLVK
ncbi:MAG: transcription repressor NadR [Peptostreptococcus sp.]|uniref:transcription repressor NadR n=1 Tax=Peptostreptococcus sp. TaxID=1262 RepID=UPI002FC8AA64